MSDGVLQACRRVIAPALLCVGLFLVVCHSGHKTSWTFMFYANGDNDLEHFIINDFIEMKNASGLGVELTVIALVDRVDGYSTVEGDWTDTRMYHLQFNQGGAPSVVELSCAPLGLTVENQSEELNLGDWQVLSNFVEYVIEHYASDYYALIIGGHGSGWLPSGFSRAISPDASSLWSSIGIRRLKQALSGKGIDLLVLDTCLMGGLEVTYELRHCARHLVASPGYEEKGGYNYQITLGKCIEGCSSSAACANAFVEGYALSNPDISEGVYHYDMEKIAEIVETGLIDSLVEKIISIGFAQASQIRSGTLNYRYGDKELFVDLADLAKKTQSQNLEEALRGAIKGKGDDVRISIYFPQYSSDYLATYQTEIDFTDTTTWDEFLCWYYGEMY